MTSSRAKTENVFYKCHSAAINNDDGECICTGNIYFMRLGMTFQWTHLVNGKIHN
jgi:hypothetical protein